MLTYLRMLSPAFLMGCVCLFVYVDSAVPAPDSTVRNSVAVCDPYSPDQCLQPGYGWSYAAQSGGIITNADVTIVAAAPAGYRNYLRSLQIFNAHATVGTEVVVKDGTTVLWRGYAPAQATNTAGQAQSITFGNALRTSAATAMVVTSITSGAQVYLNAQGYTGK